MPTQNLHHKRVIGWSCFSALGAANQRLKDRSGVRDQSNIERPEGGSRVAPISLLSSPSSYSREV
jgi:hypothetical protein